jgi:hypothetical protein
MARAATAGTSVAAASWGRKKWKRGLGLATPASGNVFDNGPGNETGLTVEIFVNSAWTDITPYVYYRNLVHITRGKPNETSQVQPQTCTMTINNRDGRFSPRNPLGAYYGQIGRNTPIRVSRLQNGVRRYRFYGEVPEWPTNADVSGADVYTDIAAFGQLRRLAQGNQPLRSTMYRSLGLGLGLGHQPTAYWPCEDGPNSTAIASGLAGGTPMTLSGQALPTFSSNTSFLSSLPLPLLSASTWTGTIPTSSTGDSNSVGFLLSIPPAGAVNGAVLLRLYTAGTIARLDLLYGTTGSGSLRLIGYDRSSVQLFDSGYVSPSIFPRFIGFNGLPVFVTLFLGPAAGSPGVVSYGVQFSSLYPLTPIGTNFVLSSGTLSGSIGVATSIIINPDGNINDTAVGQVFYQPNIDLIDNLFASLNAWITELPTTPTLAFGIGVSSGRFLRLCQEQNVQGAVISATGIYAGDATTMGYQLDDTFINLVQGPATSSGGLLFEARDQAALVLRERGSLYNQSAQITLDYAQHQLSAQPVPVDDDAFTRNNVTVTRIGGSSSIQALTSGALSIQAPPNGVGDYPTNYDLSLGADSLVADAAGWRLHLGTVDEPRYPQISINLRHSTFTGNLDLMNAALTIDIGDRLVVNNPPAWLPPDPISQIVQGYSETIGRFEHDITFNCSPESPYRVAVLGDTLLSQVDTDGSTLSQTYPLGTETTIKVATTTSTSPLWTTAAGDFPFDINVGGERMTVTNITGGSSPQTFTVTRSVNGVVKAQTSGTDVRLFQPAILSL